jgi:hypothetical protein
VSHRVYGPLHPPVPQHPNDAGSDPGWNARDPDVPEPILPGEVHYGDARYHQGDSGTQIREERPLIRQQCSINSQGATKNQVVSFESRMASVSHLRAPGAGLRHIRFARARSWTMPRVDDTWPLVSHVNLAFKRFPRPPPGRALAGTAAGHISMSYSAAHGDHIALLATRCSDYRLDLCVSHIDIMFDHMGEP